MATARTRRNSARRSAVDPRARAAIWLAALAPLVWLPGGFSRFVFPKLLIMAIACVVAACTPATGRLPRRICWALAAGAACFVLVALLGATPLASLLGRWPRYEGLPVLALYAGAAWVGARVAGHTTRAAGELTRALTWTSWILFAFSALDALGVSPLGRSSNGSRSGTILGNATDQALVAMMIILALAPLALRDRNREQLAAIAASAVTLALSGSRMPLLVTVLGLIAIAVLHDRRLARPTLLALGGLALVVLALPQTRDRLLSSHTVSGRWMQWKLSAGMVGDHPLTGYGPSRYVDAFGAHETHAWVRFTGIRTYADSPHNLVLQIALAGGVLLLAAAAVIAVLVVRAGLRAARADALAFGLFLATTGYGVAMLANFTIASSTCLAAFLGGALVSERVTTEDTEPVWRRSVIGALAGAAALALALGCVSEIALERGMTALSRGDLSAASSDFATARHLRPLDGDVSMLEAQTLAAAANAGSRPAADQTADRARASLDRTPDTYASLLALGTALLTQNHPDQALIVFTKLTDDYPMRPDAFVQRGIARFGTGDRAGARTDLEHARWIAPHYRLPQVVLKRLAAAR